MSAAFPAPLFHAGSSLVFATLPCHSTNVLPRQKACNAGCFLGLLGFIDFQLLFCLFRRFGFLRFL